MKLWKYFVDKENSTLFNSLYKLICFILFFFFLILILIAYTKQKKNNYNKKLWNKLDAAVHLLLYAHAAYMISKLVLQKFHLSLALICGVHDLLNPQPNKVQVQLESSTSINFLRCTHKVKQYHETKRFIKSLYQDIEPCSQLLPPSSHSSEPKSWTHAKHP